MILLDVLKYDVVKYLQVNELLTIRSVCKYFENILYVSQLKIPIQLESVYLNKIITDIPIEHINILQIKTQKHTIKKICLNYGYYRDYCISDLYINIENYNFLILNFSFPFILLKYDIYLNFISRFPINQNNISIITTNIISSL